MWFSTGKASLLSPEDALPGRSDPMPVEQHHAVYPQARIQPPYPEGMATAVFGMGCFWGAEQVFWQLPGVYSTSVGYAGGYTPNPTYEEVCTGATGHAEVLQVVYHPQRVSYEQLLRTFWENHDPTQGMRQGNDVGTQYRSAIYFVDDAQRQAAEESRDTFAGALQARGFGEVTTEIAPLAAYYFAETYHQQYLHRNKNGYCGIQGTGVSCPVSPGQGGL